jgi:pantoate--beta-alanine ligase
LLFPSYARYLKDHDEILFACSLALSQRGAMRIVTSVAAMQRLAKTFKSNNTPIGFVPTMGYLHAGHISLVHKARKLVGKKGQVVVSIYVNPTQFAPTEDLSKYPRDLARDKKLCRDAGVDIVFLPSDKEIYPPGYSTYVVEEMLSKSMEGASRPTHFRGVTTIVAKLFNMVLPDVAIFGQKDFQQAAVLQKMVADLNFPLKLVVAPTVREPDGLAMSSRNKYLTPSQREQATVLKQTIDYARKAVAGKTISSPKLKSDMARLIAGKPEARINYVELFDPKTLKPAPKASPGVQVALAVFFGKTRLIDNDSL